MKKKFILLGLILSGASALYAQFQAGPNGLYLRSGTVFSTEGLVMVPSDHLNFSNTGITRSDISVNGSLFNSINRVYLAGAAFNYRGKIGLFYRDAELNGNLNAGLQLAYNSSNAADYTISSGSTVNIDTRYIEQLFSSAVNLAGITAISRPVNPPISLLQANNIMSPNGDGMNDNLVIKNIEYYPNSELIIFDRGGSVVFRKKNYNNDWDATIQGAPLLEDTYYYIIDPGPGLEKIRGYITIVRN